MAAMSVLDMEFFGATILSATPAGKGIRPSSVVYWSRCGLAILTALICYSLRVKGNIGIAVALTLYVASSILYKYGLRYGDDELKGKYRTVSLGSGTFVFVWASLWILLYTVRPY